jgi:hypothetical protein
VATIVFFLLFFSYEVVGYLGRIGVQHMHSVVEIVGGKPVLSCNCPYHVLPIVQQVLVPLSIVVFSSNAYELLHRHTI